MTSKVVLTIPAASITTQQLALATGASVAGIKFDLGAGAPPVVAQAAADGSYSATFDGVADGTYTSTYQAVDSLGNTYGAPDTQSITIATAPVTVDVPVPVGAVTVTVTPDAPAA